MITLTSSLVDVVGKRTADRLHQQLEMLTVADLLRHYPRTYLKRGQATTASQLQVGDYVSFMATVKSSKWIPGRYTKRKIRGAPGRLVVTLEFGDGEIDAVFWNQIWLEQAYPPGLEAVWSGSVEAFNHRLQLANATAEIFSAVALDISDGPRLLDPDRWHNRWLPIYPAKAKLPSHVIRDCIELTLDALMPPEDPLTLADRERLGVVDYDTALRDKHLPPSDADLNRADARLKLHEAMGIQLALAKRRVDAQSMNATARPRSEEGVAAAFDRALPFELTTGQRTVGEQITTELAESRPMHRLLQGDVGSGKTLVALRAMLQVVDSGGQAVLLAPTEVLVFQHARSIRRTLGTLGSAGELDSDPNAVKIVVLSSGLGTAARRQALSQIASGEADLVIGTHALLQDSVTFADLALVVVDEQHRFGVEQRDLLRRKGPDATMPHTLVMTATPIPRTVAITTFGDLETSTMTDMPPGRSPVKTTLVLAQSNPAWVDRAWTRIREEVAAGHQGYIVCPSIGLDDASDVDDAAAMADEADKRRPIAVLELAEQLRAGQLAGLRIGILHGKLAPEVKDRTMQEFAAGEIDVLVATTVIEVGVDVANATVMVVMDADRFGMSTLHQLRGRVGRGSEPGLCLLISEIGPYSPAIERLRAVEATTNGFELAQADLENRREGDVLGTEQSGTRSQLKLLSLIRDLDVIETARDYAQFLLTSDPNLDAHPVLKDDLDALQRAASAQYLTKG